MKKHALWAAPFLPLLLWAAAAGPELPEYNPPPRELPPEIRYVPAGNLDFSGTGAEAAPGCFRRVRSLDGEWRLYGLRNGAAQFPDTPEKTAAYSAASFRDDGWEKIPVPLNWYERHPELYDAKRPYVEGYYRTEFELDAAEAVRGVSLHFGVAPYRAVLYVNGRRAGEHAGEFMPWDIEVGNLVKPGRNVLALHLRCDFGPSLGNIGAADHAYGSQWNRRNVKGGLWQGAELRLDPSPVSVGGLQLRPDVGRNLLHIDYRVRRDAPGESRCRGTVRIHCAATGEIVSTADAGEFRLAPGINSGSVTVPAERLARWSPETPVLYYITLILAENENAIAAHTERFGFRTFETDGPGFRLNGQRIYLFGENLPVYLWGGYADEAARTRGLREKLRNFKALGCNIVRTAHMPATPALYEYADEIGMMIYNEWSWCFTRNIAGPAFGKNNLPELAKFIERDFNHPSVVMWSLGNEIMYRDNPAVAAQLDGQVELVRRLDRSGRPAGVFSGSADWRSYGDAPRPTDFLDLHSYAGNSNCAWTGWRDHFDRLYRGAMERYAALRPENMPCVIWECVGFSWGEHLDPAFRANDFDAYLGYTRKAATWAKPQGIGNTGGIPLRRAVSPGGQAYARSLYGRRILEQIRQDPRVAGFAPWFQDDRLPAASLWNQPVLVGLRNERRIPPRNLFSGPIAGLELFAVNHSNRRIDSAEAVIRLQITPDRSVGLGRFRLPPLPEFSSVSLPVSLDLPAGVDGGCQLRLDLFDGEKPVSRNYYPVLLQDRKLLTRPLPSGRRVAVLRTGRFREVRRILTALGADCGEVPPENLPDPEHTLLIVPPDASPPPDHRLRDFASRGGTLLILEQPAGGLTPDASFRIVENGHTFVDLIFPDHPAFRGLGDLDFDTWENPPRGFAVENTITPFSLNTLAARGPLLGGRGSETVVLEAVFDRGRIFQSQLAAVKLWGVDSAASRYLFNLLEYLITDGGFPGIRPLAAATAGKEFPVTSEANLKPIDLRACANRNFTDWTGEPDNNFAAMPAGRRHVAKIPFDIIDPAGNGGRSCLILKGSAAPGFPEARKGIAVHRKLSRIFFLHCTAWTGSAGEDAGRYRIRYADGTFCDFILRPGINVADWWSDATLPEAAVGITGRNSCRNRLTTYAACWENPFPEKEIAAFDFFSALAAEVKPIDYNPGNVPIPILIAATGEEAPHSVLSLGGRCRAGAKFGFPPEIGTETALLPGGRRFPATTVAFPAAPERKSFVTWDFRKELGGRALAGFTSLTFWCRASRDIELELVLPEREWKKTLKTTLSVSGGEWRKIRIPLDSIGRGEFLRNGRELRGELLIYKRFPSEPAGVSLAGMTLEQEILK